MINPGLPEYCLLVTMRTQIGWRPGGFGDSAMMMYFQGNQKVR
jgi:hypothetical protein